MIKLFLASLLSVLMFTGCVTKCYYNYPPNFTNQVQKVEKVKSPRLLAEIGGKKFYKITGNSVFGINTATVVVEDTKTKEITVLESFAGNGVGSSLISGSSLIAGAAVHGASWKGNGGNSINNTVNNALNNNNSNQNNNHINNAVSPHHGHGHHKD